MLMMGLVGYKDVVTRHHLFDHFDRAFFSGFPSDLPVRRFDRKIVHFCQMVRSFLAVADEIQRIVGELAVKNISDNNVKIGIFGMVKVIHAANLGKFEIALAVSEVADMPRLHVDQLGFGQ